MKKYKSAKYISVNMSLGEYMEDFEKDFKLETDPSFQSSATDSRWSSSQMVQYIISIFTSKAPIPFIFADVNSCLKYAEEREQIEDIEYFKYWKNKFEDLQVFLNIDSFNRNYALDEFINNRLKLPECEIMLEGIGTWKINNSNNTFETMPSSLRDAFLKSEIFIQSYQEATREDLSDIFSRTNSGQELSRAAKRNCILTAIADKVRKLSDDNNELFTTEGCKWFSKKEKINRGIDKFVSVLFAVDMYDWRRTPITENLLDEMYSYDNQFNINKSLSRSDKTVKSFLSLLNKNYFLIISKATLLHLFIFYKEAIDENYKLDKPNEMRKAFINIIVELSKSDELYRDSSKKGVAKTFAVMAGGMQLSNLVQVHNLLKKNGFDIKKYMTKIDKKRVHTDLQKLIKATEQNFKTPEGKDINPQRLFTSDYHKGHIIHHSLGGSSEDISNLVVQTKKDNQKLGNKILK